MPLPTDYTRPEHWLYTPPALDFPVDVFYLYPTGWPGDAGGDAVCGIDHAAMRRGAETVFGVQATVFFPLANVYAPYYRQFNVAAPVSAAERDALIGGRPLEDVAAAFDHYLREWNQGRPFFVFAHSQGSHVGRRLVFDFIARRADARERLIAAYLIGYGVTEDELAACPAVPFAERADDTGVVVSYNTEPPGFSGENPAVPRGSVAINPLTWTRGETPAPASCNPGSLLTGRGRLQVCRHFADATVNRARGVVVCASVDPAVYGGPPPMSPFHGLDVGFYYQSLRENAEVRRDAFFVRRPKP